MLSKFANPLICLVLPQQCTVCGGTVVHFGDGVACRKCWNATRLFGPDSSRCEKCGFFLEYRPADRMFDCGRCFEWHFDKARAVGLYEKALAATVLDMKVRPRLPLSAAKHLRQAFADADFGDIDLLVPVPLSKKRYLERGFNQAFVLAGKLGRKLRIDVDRHSLVRSVHTPRHRAGMDKKAREMTVQNAFDVTRPKLIAGKKILLVDDVFTSGATASACARILKESGAAAVNVLTIARAS